jgi:hypothetical protein
MGLPSLIWLIHLSVSDLLTYPYQNKRFSYM